MSPVAFDTNVLAYAAGVGHSLDDKAKGKAAERLLTSVLDTEELILPAQVCVELHHLLIRKRRISSAVATAIVRDYMTSATIIGTDGELLEVGFEIAARYGLQTFDAVILAASAAAGCPILYSEDMQHGFEWGGMTVLNPFR